MSLTDRQSVTSSIGSSTEVYVDSENGVQVVDTTGLEISPEDLYAAFKEQAPEIAAITRWSNNMQRYGSLFERDRYVVPHGFFDQMRLAQAAAADDDVVSGVLETTQSLAFSRIDIECEDEDEEDIWNQIAEDIELDARIREMWREEFTVSQFYCAIWWTKKDYKVRGKSKSGVTRKKTFNGMRVPGGLSLLDPTKILPVGNFMFGREQLAYIADRGEVNVIEETLDNPKQGDPVIARLFAEPYTPTPSDVKILSDLGIAQGTKLFLMNPRSVFRHTSTRPQYKPFADIRLLSVMELLDLKHQLRESDRAYVMGSTNFIILVKKGTDQRPAVPQEISNLQGQMRTMARVPVIVGDHRLAIEIITPKLDNTLKPERYNILDSRIAGRLFQMFQSGLGASTGRSDDSMKMTRVIAAGLEGRRHMLKTSIMKNVFTPAYQMNDKLTSEPEIVFHPKQIALDFDPGLADFYMQLRDRGDISRQTLLNQVDLDEDVEARKREREKEYDKTFAPTNVPFSPQTGGPSDAPAKPPMDPKTGGRRQGGTRNGGGAAPGSNQGQNEKDPRRT